MSVTTTIRVREIHCESCEHTIRAALSQLDGVLRVTPSVTTHLVRVSYDELTISEDDLRARLTEVGFEPVN